MTTASIYQGQSTSVPVINAAANIQEQWFTATAAQVLFTLTLFTYTPLTKSIFVYINGVMQQRTVDYTETSTTTVTLTSGLNAGDKVLIIGYAFLGVVS